MDLVKFIKKIKNDSLSKVEIIDLKIQIMVMFSAFVHFHLKLYGEKPKARTKV